jgi:motility quorum-sensing regulator/GCU-specific mRNA interferase toxin
MEKRKPHYPLPELIRLLKNPATRRITRVALEGALGVGLDKTALMDVALSLVAAEFYKSMTTHADTALWQDVYHAQRDGYDLYIKLQAVEGVGVVISFKER